MCSHEPSLFPCSSCSPPTTDALRSSRLRFMRFSQPKQIVKTPGGVQSHACYRKINDISIGDFSQTPTTIPPSTALCSKRRILHFYDEFPYLTVLNITDISQLLIGLKIFFLFFNQGELCQFCQGLRFQNINERRRNGNKSQS